MLSQRARIRSRAAEWPPSPLEKCDARNGNSRREGSDLASENAAGRAVMNDASSCWREDTRLPVGELDGRLQEISRGG